ncbi:MAG: glycoside hydrolase family 88 protein [Treponema sp.]
MPKQIRLEPIVREERFGCTALTRQYIENAIAAVLKKIDGMMERFGEQFPFCASTNGRYEIIDNIEWTTGFWTGMLHLAYEYTGNEKYRNLADAHVLSFKERIARKGPDVQHHDLGFLYTLSCTAAYKLTGNTDARAAALDAADFLSTRYLEKAGIIQAWGNLNDPEQRGRMIIDCNLNLPLLYWASEETGNPRYREMAYTHVKHAQEHIVREDASTFHTFYMDAETGLPKYGKTHQGKSDDSCWARGQAWGVYGFMLSYRYTHDASFLDLVQKLAHYFLNRLPSDLIPYWDLSITEPSEEPRDSSSAAIVVCGLLELLKYLPLTDPHRPLYERAVYAMVKNMTEYYVSTKAEEDGVLAHSTYALPQKLGIDEFCIWGDYYYFEALIRLYKAWQLYW